MVAWTYAVLTSAIVDEAELIGDSDFQTQLPNIIDRAEWRLTRDLDSFGLVVNFHATMSVASPWLPKPTGTLIVKALSVQDGSGRRTNLVMRTNEWLLEYWPDRTSVGAPKYYANYDNTTLVMAPAPASANDIEMQFIVRPSALGASQSTNYFTDFTPSALFAASMLETAYWMKNTEMAGAWDKRYQDELALCRNEGRRQRRDDTRDNKSPISENNLIPGAQ